MRCGVERGCYQSTLVSIEAADRYRAHRGVETRIRAVAPQEELVRRRTVCRLGCASSVQQFAGLNRPNFFGSNSDKSHGVPAAVHKLNLVSATVFVYMYYSPYVSTIELVVGRVAVQYHQRMFSNHLFSSG